MSDLARVYALLDSMSGELAPNPDRWQARADWLQWTVLGYGQFARLDQPPFGERAIVLRNTGQLIGLLGYVPVFDALPQIAALAPAGGVLRHVNAAELGLYYHVSSEHRCKGYASEAAQALVDFAFATLRAWRIVAMTTHDNSGSIGVMRRLGMAILRNPYADPQHLQIIGVRYNPVVLTTSG